MTSGRKLTDADRMHILRHHAEGMQWGTIFGQPHERREGRDERAV